MLVDWFTVGAQALNFLILVWLLKRFLYQPVLNAIDARENRIASELASAEEKATEARQARELWQQKNELFDRQRDALLNKATAAADAERKRLLEAARQEANELIHKRQAALQRQQQQLAAEINACTRQEVLAITRQALSSLASVTLEAGMTEKLLAELQQPDPEIRRRLTSLRSTDDPLTISSAFPLTSQQQNALQDVLEQLTGSDVPLKFTSKPDLINGIELSIGGYKLGWNITEYLRAFEQRLNELLTANRHTEPGSNDSNHKAQQA